MRNRRWLTFGSAPTGLMAWTAWVAGVLVAVGWLLAQGVRLDTRLADLAPRAERPAAVQQLADRADAFAASAVRIVLIDEVAQAGTDRIDAASEALSTLLDAMPMLERLDDRWREARLVERLAPHRFSLLPDRMLRDLREARPERIADTAIAALYAPDLALRPLPFESDPLNLLGGWLDQRLRSRAGGRADGRAAADGPGASATRYRLIEARLRGDDERTAVQGLEAAIATVQQAHPGVRVLRTGVPLFAAEAAERSRSDIDRISVGSLLGLLLLLLPVFRSVWPLLLPALSIAVGAASGTVLVLLLHGSMHVLTLVFGASLIGIVIDYSVHGFAHRAATADAPSGGRMPRALLRALTLSLLTSGLGYAALGLSSVQALSRVALFSVGGLFGAWLTVVALLPLLALPARGLRWHASWVDPVVRALLALGERVVRLVGLWPGARSVLRLRLFALGVAALLALTLIGPRADDDPRRLIELSPALIDQAQAIATLVGEPDVARRYLISAAHLDDVWRTLALLREALPPGVTLSAADDWFDAPSRLAEDRERAQGLLVPDGPVAQVFDALGEARTADRLATLRADLAADAAAPLQAVDLLDDPLLGLPPLLSSTPGGVAALALLSSTTGARQPAVPSDALRASIDTAELPAGVRVTLIDAVADTTAALAGQRRSALALLAVAVVAVLCLLAGVYRRAGVLSLVAVPVGAIVATLATLAAAGVPLTLFHVMGLFLVLGLGMDYTIFLAELGRCAQRTTLAAIVLSAATSLLSFGLLATSGIPVARFFAQTVFIGNAFSLVFTFVLFVLIIPAASRRVPIGSP